MGASQRWHYLRFPEKEIFPRELFCLWRSEVEGDAAGTCHGDWISDDNLVSVSLDEGIARCGKRLSSVYHIRLAKAFLLPRKGAAAVYLLGQNLAVEYRKRIRNPAITRR